MLMSKQTLENFLKSPETQKLLDQRNEAKKSKGNRKFWNYFLHIIKTDKFRENLIKFREKYGIPKTGLIKTNKSFSSVPSLTLFKFDKKNKQTSNTTLINDSIELCRQFNLPFTYSPRLIRVLLYDFDVDDFNYASPAEAICIINDLGTKRQTLSNEEHSRYDLIDYPIAIQISPYASENDIVDFVKKSYSYKIKGLQEAYKINTCKIGKIKEKRIGIQKRNEYIFKNKHLPIKKIRELLAKEKIFLDDGHIGKILSLENKKRKEV